MTEASLGYDSEYLIFDAVTEEFVSVGEVFNITPPGGTADRVDVTHMKSPGRRREYIAGLIDSGEASFEINFVPGSETDQMLRGLLSSGEIVSHRIIFPNGVSVTYNASLTGYEKTIPVDDRMTATITVAPSGDEIWDDTGDT